MDPTPTNGQVNFTGQDRPLQINGRYLLNTVATFMCNSDSVLVGSASSTCQPLGMWNPPFPSYVRGND